MIDTFPICAAWGKLGEDHRPIQTAANFMDASAGVESVIFRARQTIIDRGWTRFDVSAPFAHYDLHGSGLISVAHSMAAMAELGELGLTSALSFLIGLIFRSCLSLTLIM